MNDHALSILIQTKPFIVSTNLSIISLFHETLLRLLHDMSSSLEIMVTWYPKACK